MSLTGGISYDRLSYPTDYRNPPILDSESSRSRVSPKAGFIWNPMGKLTFRGAYTRSLGGVSFDESVQLEPNQVAGFNQVFRSIISESVVGSVAAPTFENAGLLVENKFGTRHLCCAASGALALGRGSPHRHVRRFVRARHRDC